MTPHPPEGPRPNPDDGPGPSGNPYVDEEAATDRTTDAGPLFEETYRPGESGEAAGLIAGRSEDPVLLAGVGYPLLGDLSVGTVIAYRIAASQPDGVAVADCSNTPVAAYQTITAGSHETLVVVGAEKRGGELNDGTPSESPGEIHEYGPEDFGAREPEVVDLIGESAMGSNTVRNVMVVATTLGECSENTHILTVEPGYDSWGLAVDEFTSPVEDALDELLERVRDLIETG